MLVEMAARVCAADAPTLINIPAPLGQFRLKSLACRQVFWRLGAYGHGCALFLATRMQDILDLYAESCARLPCMKSWNPKRPAEFHYPDGGVLVWRR